MGSDPWWIWLLPILFSGPWVAGVIWICLRRKADGREPPPSLAEIARRRLWDS
jgi:hypothetical protein